MSSAYGQEIGQAMHARLTSLYPICRSITGDGVRQTLAELQTTLPLVLQEVPSGTKVFDWTVPNEWNIRDAWIKNSKGQRVVDFQQSNLHVVSYSTPIHATMPLSELRSHLHSLPDRPDAVPNLTSYYQESWGFCLSHNRLTALEDEQYEVCIDSTLAPGSLTYGELLVPGESSDEVLFSSHICHPSLANDNLSGIVVAAQLAAEMASRTKLRYSYRFLFVPASVGVITWLALNEMRVDRIRHGLVLSGVGDSGSITYKRSRQGSAEIDRVVAFVLENSGLPHTIQDFSPLGYDERQYCSPGFNLPVGRFSRTPYGTYPQYHTSDDNPDFVKADSLAESLRILRMVVDVLEGSRKVINTQPKCEPQLGKRGLYSQLSKESETTAMLWILNYSDGNNTLMDIARRASIPIERVIKVASILESKGLLK